MKNHPSMAHKMTDPDAKFSNYQTPRPAGPVMGPPRLRLPSDPKPPMLDTNAMKFPTSPVPNKNDRKRMSGGSGFAGVRKP